MVKSQLKLYLTERLFYLEKSRTALGTLLEFFSQTLMLETNLSAWVSPVP